MSSDGEEEQCAFYGKPLEQYDEDSIPKRRPISVEEQTARDAQGRRRFHGAFTGGFSAGFFNTVGSLEGWKPTEFKSSRSEKAGNKVVQRPEDFMDDEDISEFGIAPQTVKATKDYNTSKKRRRKGFSDGPIPGAPVLQTLIESNTETIGYLLLRHMGFKHGTEDEDEEDADVEDVSEKRIYGCEMPKPVRIKPITTTNLHRIYESALKNPKDNSFGLGYSRLEKQHGHLMTSSNLIIKDRNNKTLSIAGQAFGVGAFEEDDDDIYSREDMSNYDYEMSKESKKVEAKDCNNLTVKMFTPGRVNLGISEVFLPPSIPKSFTGKHMVRKSRFEPVIEVERKEVRRCDKNADYRADILGEEREKVPDKRVEVLSDIRVRNSNTQRTENSVPSSSSRITDESENETKVKLEPPGLCGLIFDRFVSAGKSEEHTDIMERVESTQHGTKDMRDAAKMKMFGTLTRISISWNPHSIVCRRFNVPEPVFNEMETKPRKRTRNLIFENETFTEKVETVHNAGLTMRSEKKPEVVQTGNDLDVTMIPLPGNDVKTSVVDENKNANNVLNEAKTENQSEISSNIVKKSLDPTEKLDISKNADLFKAIFQDSDDEEEDTTAKQKDYEEEMKRETKIKEQILSDELLLPKIKPIKEGILSNVDLIVFKKPVKKTEVEEPTVPDLYGPKLPERANSTSDQYRKGIVEIHDGIEDEWVVKGEESKKKEHKHKKHKKHKKKSKRKRD